MAMNMYAYQRSTSLQICRNLCTSLRSGSVSVSLLSSSSSSSYEVQQQYSQRHNYHTWLPPSKQSVSSPVKQEQITHTFTWPHTSRSTVTWNVKHPHNNTNSAAYLHTTTSILNATSATSSHSSSSSSWWSKAQGQGQGQQQHLIGLATTATAATSVIGFLLYILTNHDNSNEAHADSSSASKLPIPIYTHKGEEVASADKNNEAHTALQLPIYRSKEVAQHRTAANGIWVTYKGNVYDVTDFIEEHPGGKGKIMLAAGTDLSPFWSLYPQHQKEEILKILERYKIGQLSAEDTEKQRQISDSNDPYANEPQRHPALVVVNDKPFNSETPNEALDTFLTPNELFYVRNHLMTPPVDATKYKLIVTGNNIATKEYTLDELQKKFKEHIITSTIQCAGNRRHEQHVVKPVKGLDWSIGAIANAKWTGVKLRDVLQDAGMDVNSLYNGDGNGDNNDNADIQHIHFYGADVDPTNNTGYAASIPIDKAVDARGDVLLAYKMNDQTLPADHGYPLRAVVPGVVGARNVKWLNKIVASDKESDSHWQQKDYKSFSPSTDWDTVDWGAAPAIQELPVNSAIIQPTTHDSLTLDDDELVVKGYAYSGGGHDIVRVDVSCDDGDTWHTAMLNKGELQHIPAAKRNQQWGWTLWEAVLPIDDLMKRSQKTGAKQVKLICKAVDNQYNVQPDGVAGVWTLRGVLNNAWHRVDVPIEGESSNK
jgi:sulfite oxidase